MPKISVCIPSYNHQDYIAKTIQSILDQSFQDFEIIISDDNSSDNTVAIAKTFTDSRIKVITNIINQGPSINSNIAIANSSSELIALIASDDIMHKDRLAKTFDAINLSEDIGAVFTWIEAIDQNNQIIDCDIVSIFNKESDCGIEAIRKFFYEGNFLCAPSCLIRKDVIESCEYFNPLLLQLQDFEMWIKILLQGKSIKVIKEKLTFYRVFNGSLSYVDNKNTAFFSRILFETEKVLEQFLKIDNITLLLSIFPEIKELYPNIKSEYKNFYIAKLALSKSTDKNLPSLAYKNFALNTIYKFYQDKDPKEIIKDLKFRATEFFGICSQNYLIDYNLLEPRPTECNTAHKKSFRHKAVRETAKLLRKIFK